MQTAVRECVSYTKCMWILALSLIQWNLYNEDTIGTTVNSPVQWDLYNEDTIGTTVNSLVQWNLYNEDTIGTTVNSPV